MAYSWSSLIPQGVGFGLGILGNKIANRANQQQNAWSRALTEQEIRRRNMLQGIAAPSMLRALGYTDPNQIQRMTMQISGQGMNPTGNFNAPNTPGSTAGKILGLGATGAGLGGLAAQGLAATGMNVGALAGPLSFLGGPVGMAAAGVLGLGSLAANKISQGRRTANLATQNGGYEQQFDQAMAEAVRRRDSGDLEGAKQVLQQGYNTFMEGARAFQQKGGNYAKVAEQALTQNKPKWDTYRAIAQSLGMSV